MGPYFRDWVPIATFYTFWVSKTRCMAFLPKSCHFHYQDLVLLNEKNTTCKKFGPNRSFQPSGVPKAIYNGLYEVATTN